MAPASTGRRLVALADPGSIPRKIIAGNETADPLLARVFRKPQKTPANNSNTASSKGFIENFDPPPRQCERNLSSEADRDCCDSHLVDLDIRRLDQFLVSGVIRCKLCLEFFWRGRDGGFGAVSDQVLYRLRGFDALLHDRVDRSDYHLRRACRREQTVTVAPLETRNTRFGDRRHVRKRLPASRARHGHYPKLARLDVLRARERAGEHQVKLPASHND